MASDQWQNSWDDRMIDFPESWLRCLSSPALARWSLPLHLPFSWSVGGVGSQISYDFLQIFHRFRVFRGLPGTCWQAKYDKNAWSTMSNVYGSSKSKAQITCRCSLFYYLFYVIFGTNHPINSNFYAYSNGAENMELRSGFTTASPQGLLQILRGGTVLPTQRFWQLHS